MIGVSIYRSFRGVKHDIHGPACRRNLQAIGAAVAKYSLKNLGRVPGKDWMDELRPFVDDEGVFYCPTAGDQKKGVHGYAMNEKFVGASMGSIPADVPLFFDSTLTARNAVGSLSTLPIPGRHLDQDGDDRHDKWLNNVGFVSGSARSTVDRFER